MRVAIQCAMPAELRALPGCRELSPEEIVCGIPVYRLGPDLLAAVGGVGKVNAAMGAALLAEHCGAELILSAGVAGCLTDLPLSEVVVVDEFVQHDVDSTAVGDPIGLVSTVNQTVFPTWEPERCRAILRELGCTACGGRAATGDWFAVQGQRAAWIRDTFHPTLIEMEGGAIAQVCLRCGVRFVAVKSVSDHLFSPRQADEYFDFGQALENMGKLTLPLAQKLREMN